MALQSLENALFRMTRTLSVKTRRATMHIMSLLLPRGKHNCGQHLHTLSGGVCGSRVFAMIFFCLWKDLLKCVEPCCWNELMKSQEAAVKCYIDIASRQSAWLLFTWSNLLGNTFFWLFLILFSDLFCHAQCPQPFQITVQTSSWPSKGHSIFLGKKNYKWRRPLSSSMSPHLLIRGLSSLVLWKNATIFFL